MDVFEKFLALKLFIVPYHNIVIVINLNQCQKITYFYVFHLGLHF